MSHVLSDIVRTISCSGLFDSPLHHCKPCSTAPQTQLRCSFVAALQAFVAALQAIDDDHGESSSGAGGLLAEAAVAIAT